MLCPCPPTPLLSRKLGEGDRDVIEDGLDFGRVEEDDEDEKTSSNGRISRAYEKGQEGWLVDDDDEQPDKEGGDDLIVEVWD